MLGWEHEDLRGRLKISIGIFALLIGIAVFLISIYWLGYRAGYFDGAKFAYYNYDQIHNIVSRGFP